MPSKTQRDRARKLRKEMTDAERFLWDKIRLRQFNNYRFRRQLPIGPYIADFVSPEAKLILELDGGQHSENRSYDERRTTWLQSEGWQVLRFWNHEVFEEWDAVAEVIWRNLPKRETTPE